MSIEQPRFHTLYLHALDTPDDAAIALVRERALAQEARVLRALGGDGTGPVPDADREAAP